MKNIARRHHYLSQFYLNGFSDNGNTKKIITVVNLENGHTFKTQAKNIASIRDYNRIELPNYKPDMVEGLLSDLENKAAKAIQNIHKSKSFTGNDRDLTLKLIALYAAKHPNTRQTMTGFMSDIQKRLLLMLLRHDEKTRSGLVQIIKKTKSNDEYEVSMSEVNEFVQNGIKVEIKNEFHLNNESEMYKSIFAALTYRKWTLLESSNETGPFITSDTPVILCWDNPDIVPPMYRNHPGFLMPNTIVYFSLSQNLALIGTLDGDNSVAPPHKKLIGSINSINLIYSNGQIYAPNLNFQFLTKDNQLQTGSQLITSMNKKAT